MLNKKGFTLIELLIVISIIGLLSSIVLVGLGSFRARGRDARRIADVRSVQNMLELCFTRDNGYPDEVDSGGQAWTNLSTALTGCNIGVSSLPADPLGANVPGNGYQYDGFNGTPCGDDGGNDCLNYVLGTTLEDDTHEALVSDVDGDPPGDGNIDCDDDSSPDLAYCVEF